MKLSILICHLEEREKSYGKLGASLLEQVYRQKPPVEFRYRGPGEVEIITETDNGEMHIGQKRNVLLSKAQGDYICFVDDDDMVPDYYVEKILEAIRPIEIWDDTGRFNWTLDNMPPFNELEGMTPDVVAIMGHYYPTPQSIEEIFIHSIKYKEWLTVNGVHQRCPNHLNPVKRELALQVMFPETNHGEDMDYSLRLLPLLKTEVFIEDVMYYYLK